MHDEVLIPLFEVRQRRGASFTRLKDDLLLHFIITGSLQITACLRIRLQMSTVTAHPCRHGDDSNTTLLGHSSFFPSRASGSPFSSTPPLPSSHSVPGGIPEPAWTRPGAGPSTRPEQVKLLPVSFAQAAAASQVCNCHGNEPTHNTNGAPKISRNRSETTPRRFQPAGEYLAFEIISNKDKSDKSSSSVLFERSSWRRLQTQE